MRLAPIYRWAVNPFEIKALVRVVCHSHLPRIAEDHGLGDDWLFEANNQIGAHFPKARIFGEMLRDELLSEPCLITTQNGKAAEGGLGGSVGEDGDETKETHGTADDERANAPGDVI